jgi:IS30 family transposase
MTDRELKRNHSRRGYSASNAQMYSDERKADKKHYHLFDDSMKRLIAEKMNVQWSPEQICGWSKANNIPMVSHETIYQYIYQDMKSGGVLHKELRTQRKKRRKRTHKKDSRGLIPNRVSIHQSVISQGTDLSG